MTSINKQNHKNIISKTDDFNKHEIRRKIHSFWINRELSIRNKTLSVINDD